MGTVIPTEVEGSYRSIAEARLVREYFVYIMSSHRRTLYTGVTNNLAARVRQHKDGAAPGFTSKYNVDRLVYAESCGNVEDALNREKQIKNWRRAKKIDLIMTINPEWNDLTLEWELLGDVEGKIPRPASGYPAVGMTVLNTLPKLHRAGQ